MSQKNKKKISRKLNRVIKENRHNKKEILASYKGYFLNCQSGSYLYKHNWYQEKKKGEKKYYETRNYNQRRKFILLFI